MNYTEYLHIQSQVERMYDFHPEFFDELDGIELEILRKGFLYDTDDNTYPESLKQYYEDNVSVDEGLQKRMFAVAQKLYDLSGSGKLEDSIKNNVSFPEQ